jgi:hypothetical protein
MYNEMSISQFYAIVKKRHEEDTVLLVALERQLGIPTTAKTNEPVASIGGAKLPALSFNAGEEVGTPKHRERIESMLRQHGKPLPIGVFVDGYVAEGVMPKIKAYNAIFTTLKRNPNRFFRDGENWNLVEWRKDSSMTK